MNEWKSLQNVHVNFIYGTSESESTKTSFWDENFKNMGTYYSLISDHCPVGRKDPDPIHHSLSILISKYSCRHKPVRREPSIQCQLLIPSALTSIQNPFPSSNLSEALRNSASLDWMLLLVMRGKKELFRCWQAVWAADCVRSEPSVQRQMLTSS